MHVCMHAFDGADSSFFNELPRFNYGLCFIFKDIEGMGYFSFLDF